MLAPHTASMQRAENGNSVLPLQSLVMQPLIESHGLEGAASPCHHNRAAMIYCILLLEHFVKADPMLQTLATPFPLSSPPAEINNFVLRRWTKN